MAESPYHQVRPHITDPDLQRTDLQFAEVCRGGMSRDLPAQHTHAPAGGGLMPPASDFFQDHGLAIMVAAIVLAVLTIILYVYLVHTTNARQASTKDGPPGGARGGPETEIDLQELQRLRMMRRRARAESHAGGAFTVPALPSDSQQPPAAGHPVGQPPAAADRSVAPSEPKAEAFQVPSTQRPNEQDQKPEAHEKTGSPSYHADLDAFVGSLEDEIGSAAEKPFGGPDGTV